MKRTLCLCALMALTTEADAGRRFRNRSQGFQAPAPEVAPVEVPATPPGDHCKALLALHNAARSRSGLPPLVLDERLCAEAQHAANEQARRGQCGHFTSLGVGGENCAMGQRDEAEAIRSWLNSPGHAANMMGNWTRVGFGRAGNAWAARFAP